MLSRDRLRSQIGQTAAEALGVLVLVAIIIGVAAQTTVGEKIGSGLKEQICKIAGKSCPPEEGDEARGIPPLDECTRTSSERGIEGSVKVFFVEAGGELIGRVEVAADGSATVSLEANAELGVEFSTPGADVEGVGGADGGGGAEVGVSASGGAEYGWNFDSEEDANDFVDDVVQNAKAKLDPRPGFLGGEDEVDLPDPTTTTYQGGVEVSASAEGGGGELEGALGGGGGVTYDDETGGKTVFLELNGNVAGGVGPFGGGFAGEAQVAVDYDENGEPTNMRFIGTAQVTSGFDLDASDFQEANFEDVLSKASESATEFSASSDAETGYQGVFDANLDLTDPANRAAYDAFFSGESGGASDLLGRFNEDATLNTRLYELQESSTGGGFDGSIVGGEFYYNTSDTNIVDAWYRNKQTGGWTPWEDCVTGLAD